MNAKLKTVLYSMLMGAATAILNGLALAQFDPAHFSFAQDLIMIVKVLGCSGIVGAIVAGLSLVQKSPMAAIPAQAPAPPAQQ